MRYGQGAYRYELVEGWAKLPEGESFVDVAGVCTDAHDNVYVLNRSEHPLAVFDRGGQRLAQWGKDHFARAHGSCIGPDGALWCTDDRNHTVSKFSTEGKLLKTLGTKDRPSDTGYRKAAEHFESLASISRGGPPFNRPTGIAFSPSGEIYISDGYGNARIHRFTGEGDLTSSWGEPGGNLSEFRLPHHLSVDRWGRVWVADRENHRIQVFREDGRFIFQLTDFLRPTAVCIDRDDIIYVSELCCRISVLTMDGRVLARWGNEGDTGSDRLLVAPHAIAVDNRGDLYVGEVAVTHAKLDRGARTIQKFARVG